MKRGAFQRRAAPLDFDVQDESGAAFYHDGGGRGVEHRKMTRQAKLADKPFVVWDGEGARAEGKRKPQHYVLFGYYDGMAHDFITSERLGTRECLDFIIQAGREHPDAWHVGFAFGYDVDMILRQLSPKQFAFLRDRGYTKVDDKYRVEHIPGKWFRVTEYGSTYPTIRSDKFTVTIFDIWGFFQSSLVKALKANLAGHPLMEHMPEIEEGKDERAGFTYDRLDYITKYWRIENELLHALVEKLREMLYSVDLFISKWHGPGALASFTYSKFGIKSHKADCGPAVYDAARYAYAGGRFERFHVGRYRRAFGYDINSAYPHAIAKLPSLSEGTWSHVERPRGIVEFGVYHIRMKGPAISRKPSPLFHRDKAGNITYPWRTDGWYWSPEVSALIDTLDPSDGTHVEIVEGYEYTGWHSRPFAFVAEMFNQRLAMKRAKDGAQMALKLCLNSLYGKMAQRAGWERTGGAPTWHQLEWAGWVTSYTRAQLYRVMARIPYDTLIAVETDGLYTTCPPDEAGITDSSELGGWEVTEYDELIYLQSGVYAGRQGDEWTVKFRGLDKDSFGKTPADAAAVFSNHAKLLTPGGDEWPSLLGTTTRFIGYKNALFREAQNRGPMKVHHCVWETEAKEISCGSVGKRIHSRRICKACAAGLTAYEMPHETIIKSRAMLSWEDEDLASTRHDIPWLDGDKAEWRNKLAEQEGLLS